MKNMSFLAPHVSQTGSSSYLSAFPLSSAQTEQRLPDRRQFAPSVALGQVLLRSSLDSLFGASPMRFSDVASPSCRLQHGGGDGCIGFGLGPLFQRQDASGPLVRHCRCPSPYQCEGTHGAAHLPPRLPSPFWSLSFGRPTAQLQCPTSGKVLQYLTISFA